MNERRNIAMEARGKVLVVVGDRTAGEVRESAEAMGVFAQVLPYYFDAKTLDAFAKSLGTASPAYNVGIAEPGLKRQIAELLDLQGWEAVSVVDPSAHVAPSARVDAGCFVAPGAVVSTNAKVGKHCIVHIHSSVGHDATVADYCAILPGARISGRVTVGQNSIIGSNGFVAAGVRVGEDCRIDALAYVARDLPERHLASPRLESPIRRVV